MTISMKEFLEKHNVQDGELIVYLPRDREDLRLGTYLESPAMEEAWIIATDCNFYLNVMNPDLTPIALLRFPNGRKLTDVCERVTEGGPSPHFFCGMNIIYAEQETEDKEKTAEEKLEEIRRILG